MSFKLRLISVLAVLLLLVIPSTVRAAPAPSPSLAIVITCQNLTNPAVGCGLGFSNNQLKVYFNGQFVGNITPTRAEYQNFRVGGATILVHYQKITNLVGRGCTVTTNGTSLNCQLTPLGGDYYNVMADGQVVIRNAPLKAGTNVLYRKGVAYTITVQ